MADSRLTLATLTTAAAERGPDIPALVERGRILTYGEVGRLVDAASLHLLRLGVRRGDIVAISLRVRWQQTVLMFATFRIGATACILDPYQRASERAAILAATGPAFLLVDRAQESSGSMRICMVTEEWREPPAGTALPDPVEAPDAPAILLLTSGSTGLPKIMPLSYRAALWRAWMQGHVYGLTQGARYLLALPAVATAATQAILTQFYFAATTFVLPAINSADELIELMRRERIERATMVPTMMRWLIEKADGPGMLLPDIVTLSSIGAPLFEEEVRKVVERVTPNLFIGYGATGAGGISLATPEILRKNPRSIGAVLEGLAVQIVDDDARQLPAGAIGRIRVRSPGAASGYFGGATSGDEAFVDGFVYTGDLGRFDDTGLLYIEGRASAIIIRGGQNLYPQEIERVLLEHPAVAEAVVIGRDHPSLGEVPVAWLVLKAPATTTEILATCRARLSPQKIPAALRVVEALPQTAAGKVDRKAVEVAERARTPDSGTSPA